MNLMNNFKKKGFVFFKINKQTNIYINKINNLINVYKKQKKINFESIDSKELSKHILILQKKINKIFNTKKFFIINKDIFVNFFNEKKYSIQTYFYLRITQPHKRNPKYKPIDFHREKFQGPAFFKFIMNIWIPIKNCEKKNAIRYIEKSHLFKRYDDFNLKIRKTNIVKGSTENKIGFLYKDRRIEFKKKVKISRLYKKKNFILFYGDLIHGSAKNTTNVSRISLDLRFMLEKKMKFNPIQGATRKKYFNVIDI